MNLQPELGEYIKRLAANIKSAAANEGEVEEIILRVLFLLVEQAEVCSHCVAIGVVDNVVRSLREAIGDETDPANLVDLQSMLDDLTNAAPAERVPAGVTVH